MGDRSQHISESSIARIAGNIASGMVPKGAYGSFELSYVDIQQCARESVTLARAIAAEVERTKPKGDA